MAQSRESRMNLTALQRVDTSITDILDTASQVALYQYNSKSNEWEKTEIEGTLFVYARSVLPSNGFIIMNRLSVTNMVEPITHRLEFQLQDPFLLYRNANRLAIYGIWFYDKDECARIGQLMNSLSQWASTEQPEVKISSNRQRRASESDSLFENKTPLAENSDIISLLTKALHEYDKLSSSPSRKPAVNGSNGQVIKPTPLKGSPSQEPPTALSVQELFARAEKSKEDMKAPPMPTQSNQRQHDSRILLERLKSNPENTLEHIERQMNEPPKQSPSTKLFEQDLKEKLNLIPLDSKLHESNREVNAAANLLTKSPISKLMSPVSCEELNASILKPSVMHSGPMNPMNQSNKTPLLSPMAFEQGVSKPSALLASNFTSQPLKLQSGTTASASPSLTNAGFERLQNNGSHSNVQKQLFSAPSVPKVNPLTRMQLSQALTYLLENDDDFLTKLHGAYVKSLECSLLGGKLSS